MNVNNNELRKNMPNLTDPEFNHFQEIPKDLQKEAHELLGNNMSVIIPKDSKSKLARWAQKVRENQKHNIK